MNDLQTAVLSGRHSEERTTEQSSRSLDQRADAPLVRVESSLSWIDAFAATCACACQRRLLQLYAGHGRRT